MPKRVISKALIDISKNYILIACEESGKVRDAFRALGFDAVSCDILPTREYHIQGDVLPLLKLPWMAVIAFPPCTHLAVSGAKWFTEKRRDGRQADGVAFFMACIEANAPFVAVENPVGIMSRIYRKPDQIIHPWQFGHGEQKKTCIWLKGFPPLKPTNEVSGREQRIWKMPPSPDRAKIRSETYQGIADAMAAQWANLI